VRRPIVLLLPLLTLLAACGPLHRAGAPSPSPYTVSERASVDPGTRLPGIPAPNFTLTDQFGQPISLASFRGKVVVLAFADDECTTICPLTTATLTGALGLLGPAARSVVLVGVDANPLHTSVAAVRAFSAAHGMLDRWLFLTGPLATLKSVWRAYGVEVQILRGMIDHTPAVYVIDPRGRERRVFLTSPDYGVLPLEEESLARALAPLLPGPVHIGAPKAPFGPPPASPATTVRLPLLIGRGSLHLGRGAPRLVAFLASWAPGLPGGISALADVAGGDPDLPVDLVDVGPVETAAGEKALASLVTKAGNPRLKLALDPYGRTADAYQVADIPWLVLVSAKGRILWSHDGFIPAPALAAAVHQHLVAPARP
jgi:cytochrome oxidase Cu insertion factor (SCO1/SenC/PrrC family)